MLNIIFGREHCDEKALVLDNRIWFRKHKKPEWFEDPFVKEFLKKVDNTTVLFEEALKDYRGRGISTEMISSGCKTLCCIYYNIGDQIFNGSLMGDNCVPFLMEIAKKRDITIMLEHYMEFASEYFEEGLIMFQGKVLGEYDYDDAYSDWCAEAYLD